MKILFVHPQFSHIAGAERVALKILEILTHSFNCTVTVLTAEAPNIETIDNTSEYRLDTNAIEFKVIRIPTFFRSSFRFRMAYLHRQVKKYARDFKFVISAYNELDSGTYAFQYIHHPMVADKHLLVEHMLARRPRIGQHIIQQLYDRLSDLIAHRDKSNIASNFSVANSEYIASVYDAIYGVRPDVIYPSLPIINEHNPISIRKKQILNISRFARNKNVHSLIGVFDRIHETHPEFSFVIAGHLEYADYYNEIKQLARKRPYNIELKPNCPKDKLIQLYFESEYYINPKEYEHFGIAVLEAMHSGCIPLVHASGGSLELVPYKELQFSNFSEIPMLITCLESDPDKKASITKVLGTHKMNFREEIFEEKVKKALHTYFKSADER